MTNLSQYALRNGRVVWFFLAMMLIGGIVSFFTLGKKEDAVFVIKSASLSCSYPGATPVQVEQLITEPIEREVQSMRRVYKITSESYYGLSRMLVELDPATRAAEIPQLSRRPVRPRYRSLGTNCDARWPTSSRVCRPVRRLSRWPMISATSTASITDFLRTRVFRGPNCAIGRSGSKNGS